MITNYEANAVLGWISGQGVLIQNDNGAGTGVISFSAKPSFLFILFFLRYIEHSLTTHSAQRSRMIIVYKLGRNITNPNISLEFIVHTPFSQMMSQVVPFSWRPN